MKSKKSEPKKNKISYYKKPQDLSLKQWQYLLRKQFGEENPFGIKNIGEHPFFSDFLVHNAYTNNNYKVAIRSLNSPNNFCECLDFKTNRLGICKHIAAVQKHLQALKGYHEAFNTVFQSDHSSVYLDYSQGREIKIKIGKQNVNNFKPLLKKYFEDNLSLKVDSFQSFEVFLEEAKKIDETFRCYDDALDFVIEKRSKNKLSEGFAKVFETDPNLTVLKSLMNISFFNYQIEGIKFAAKTGRSLIADDMGLGKTVQALAVAELYKKFLGVSKVLIVAPTSLKYQWKSEIERFTKSKVEVIEGNIQKRQYQYLNSAAQYLVASYNVMSNDIRFISEKMELDMVILDEAQRIKNWKTKISQSIKKLYSPYSIVLTGTPLENKLEELYSIMQFIDVYKLGPMYAFLDRYQIKESETQKVIGYRNLNEISENLKNVLIRRTKKEVLKQLPERIDKNLFVPMTTEQMEIHQDCANVVRRLINKWIKHGFLAENDRQKLILSLSKMRMVCDSTFILDQTTRHDTKIDELMSILDEYLEGDSGKVVVFSQWERMTRLVAQELESREIEFEYLHGGIPSEKRAKLLSNFRDNPKSKVFLSTDAGGVGLNLQSANMVINLDLPWNPAVLEQRIARVYRLGQNSNVSVINLISAGTIENDMLAKLKFKSALAEGILDGGEDTIFMGEDKFKSFMINLGELINTEEDKDIKEENGGILGEGLVAEELEEKIEKRPNVENLLLGDDDFVEETSEKKASSDTSSQSEELLGQGISFFSNLFQTLQDPKATQDLVSSITQKDESGKTYLKIPVENEELVENGIKALGSFLSSFMKGK